MEEKVLHIVGHVSKLYQRYGIKSVTMDDVARHLCISKKTLYEHFKDKEDLVSRVLLQEYEKRGGYYTQIEKRNLNAVEELLEVYKLIHTMFMDYNPSMEYDIRKYYPDLHTRFREIRRKRIFESAYRNLNKGKKEGLYRKDINSKVIAKLHVFRVENMFENDLFSIEEITSLKVFHQLFFYHLHGILSEKGQVFFEKNFRKSTINPS
ncbi:MAG: TetR/AcrR family transcriptional regulator [Bacteroidetes bacterium]|nr:TetR/AcrR family transcriptional regulator [Bacteroidota bacterium]